MLHQGSISPNKTHELWNEQANERTNEQAPSAASAVSIKRTEAIASAESATHYTKALHALVCTFK